MEANCWSSDREKMPPSEAGVDVDRLQRGIEALRRGLHQLTPERVRYLAPGGTFGGLTLFDLEEDTLYWLRQRRAMSLKRWTDVRAAVDAVDRPLQLGGIPRTATFSPLTGQDYEQMGGIFDLVFPKHYYWHRGFDGLYGTIARWVQRLCRWNDALTEADALLVVENLFGLRLPGVHNLLDLELGFPQEFFDDIVTSETQRALAAVGGDAQKLIFWVSTGRAPHAGDAMTACEASRIPLRSARVNGACCPRCAVEPGRKHLAAGSPVAKTRPTTIQVAVRPTPKTDWTGGQSKWRTTFTAPCFSVSSKAMVKAC